MSRGIKEAFQTSIFKIFIHYARAKAKANHYYNVGDVFNVTKSLNDFFTLGIIYYHGCIDPRVVVSLVLSSEDLHTLAKYAR